MSPDSAATYYAKLYTGRELRQLRATAAAELAALSTGTQKPADNEDQELTALLDHIRLYTAALLVQARASQPA